MFDNIVTVYRNSADVWFYVTQLRLKSATARHTGLLGRSAAGLAPLHPHCTEAAEPRLAGRGAAARPAPRSPTPRALRSCLPLPPQRLPAGGRANPSPYPYP